MKVLFRDSISRNVYVVILVGILASWRGGGRSNIHRVCEVFLFASFQLVFISAYFKSYGWWTKSCTTKDDDYPIIYRVLTISGGAGFRPSTVSPSCPWFLHNPDYFNVCYFFHTWVCTSDRLKKNKHNYGSQVETVPRNQKQNSGQIGYFGKFHCDHSPPSGNSPDIWCFHELGIPPKCRSFRFKNHGNKNTCVSDSLKYFRKTYPKCSECMDYLPTLLYRIQSSCQILNGI